MFQFCFLDLFLWWPHEKSAVTRVSIETGRKGLLQRFRKVSLLWATFEVKSPQSWNVKWSNKGKT